MNDLSHITDEELLKDYSENESDLKVCRDAMQRGVKYYQSGESIQEYVKIGEDISQVIKGEIERRGL